MYNKTILKVVVILLGLGLLLPKASVNRSKSISEIHREVNGSWITTGKCHKSGNRVTITSNNESIEGHGSIRCNGTYGEARIHKSGNNISITRFKPIRIIKSDPINVKKWIGKYAEVEIDGKTRLVKVSKTNGNSNRLLLTSRGYERM